MSFAEFFAMGGHGKFVWGAYGITFAVLAINLVFALRRLRTSEKDIDELHSSGRRTKSED